MIPFLLHHANRAISTIFVGREQFYAVKDMLLKRGKHVNYDVQHFEGKKCYTCGGTGIYTGYYDSGEKWSDTCNRCWRGWWKLPLWVCLERVKYGSYYFHRPLKREQCVRNPFTKEELGWEVTTRPLIEGRIEHQENNFGWIALLVLFYLYDRPSYNTWKREILNQLRWRYRWKFRALKDRLNPKRLFLAPSIRVNQLDEDGNILEYHDDHLPF